MKRFSDEQIESIRSDLLEKKAKFQSHKDNLVEQDPFNDVDRINDNAAVDDEAQEQSEHATTEAIDGEMDENLARVEAALDRLDQGTWGKCVECDKEIDEKRLRIDPTVSKCMACHQKEVSSDGKV